MTDDFEQRVSDAIGQLRRGTGYFPNPRTEHTVKAVLAQFGRSEAALEAGRIRDLLYVLTEEADCPPVIVRVCEALTARVAGLLQDHAETPKPERQSHPRLDRGQLASVPRADPPNY